MTIDDYFNQELSRRDFNKEIQSDYDAGFIVNEAAVKLFGWGSFEEAMGKELLYSGSKRGNILGVVRDFNFESLNKEIHPIVIHYEPEEFDFLASFFQLFDKRFHVGFGLFVRDQPEVVEVTVYGQAGNPGYAFESLRHAVAAISIVGAGFGIMVNDPVYLEKVQHLFDVPFLGFIVTDDKKLRVGFGHAAERIFRIQGGKNPAVAISRRQDIGVQG